MKATGIVRKIDELGRLVLPIELRRTLDIELKDPVEIYVDDDCIILRKYQPDCIFCHSTEKLETLYGKHVCEACRKALGG